LNLIELCDADAGCRLFAPTVADNTAPTSYRGDSLRRARRGDVRDRGNVDRSRTFVLTRCGGRAHVAHAANPTMMWDHDRRARSVSSCAGPALRSELRSTARKSKLMATNNKQLSPST